MNEARTVHTDFNHTSRRAHIPNNGPDTDMTYLYCIRALDKCLLVRALKNMLCMCRRRWTGNT
eukprot:1161189-Pelagomonas_calceolata.AAC.5